jgi:hypothetical protein
MSTMAHLPGHWILPCRPHNGGTDNRRRATFKRAGKHDFSTSFGERVCVWILAPAESAHLGQVCEPGCEHVRRFV